MPGRLAPGVGISSVGYRGRRALTGLQTAPFSLVLALLECQSSALVGQLSLMGGEFRLEKLACPIQSHTHGVHATQRLLPYFQGIQQFLEVRDAHCPRGTSIESPGSESFGSARLQLLSSAVCCFGSITKGIGIKRSSIVRARASLCGCINLAQSLADQSDLLAAT